MRRAGLSLFKAAAHISQERIDVVKTAMKIHVKADFLLLWKWEKNFRKFSPGGEHNFFLQYLFRLFSLNHTDY
jgi:hypothetical protein